MEYCEKLDTYTASTGLYIMPINSYRNIKYSDSFLPTINNEEQYFDFVIKQKINENVYRLTRGKDDIKGYFEAEGAELPNELSESNFKDLLNKYYKEKNTDYFDISPSIEGGICLEFRKNNLRLIVEIYNDGIIDYMINKIGSKVPYIELDVLNGVDEAVVKVSKFLKAENGLSYLVA